MNNFALTYPHCAALEIIPVIHAGPGFDVLDLEEKLGKDRFQKLEAKLTRVFVANHRHYPEGHALAGYEVHCVYAEDLEKFLAQEGK